MVIAVGFSRVQLCLGVPALSKVVEFFDIELFDFSGGFFDKNVNSFLVSVEGINDELCINDESNVTHIFCRK